MIRFLGFTFFLILQVILISCVSYKSAYKPISSNQNSAKSYESDATEFINKASMGDTKGIQAMISERRNPNPKNDDEYYIRAVLEAASNGHIDTVRALINYAPDLKSRDSGGTSPVFHAESNTLKILLDAGLDVNATNENGTTPLMWAARFGDFETAQILLDHGAKVNWKSKPGFTPLLDSILGGNPQIVELFLEHGASANEKLENDLSGSTPLGFAVSRNQLEVVQILLAKGANPNFEYKDGSTYLMDATYHEHLELVNILLAHKANPNLKKDNGESALKMAYEKPFIDEGVRKKIIEALKSAGANE